MFQENSTPATPARTPCEPVQPGDRGRRQPAADLAGGSQTDGPESRGRRRPARRPDSPTVRRSLVSGVWSAVAGVTRHTQGRHQFVRTHTRLCAAVATRQAIVKAVAARIAGAGSSQPRPQGEVERMRVSLKGGRLARVIFTGDVPTQADIDKVIASLQLQKDSFPEEA